MGVFASSIEDKRPVLRVTVNKIEGLARSDDDDAELDVYVQVTFGKLQKMTGRGLNEIDPSLVDVIGEKVASIDSAVSDAVNEAKENIQRITSIDEDKPDDVNNIDPTTLATSLSKDKEEIGSHSRDSLSSGKRGTETKQSKILKTQNQSSRHFNQTFYFPVAALTARYSLEISVWDKEFGPQMTDEYIGKSIIYYAKYKEDEMINKNEENKDIEHFLPSHWDTIKNYRIDIKDQNGEFVTGTIYVDVQFQKHRRDEFINDNNDSDDEEEDALLNSNNNNKYNSNSSGKKKKRKKRIDTTGKEVPQDSCCTFGW